MRSRNTLILMIVVALVALAVPAIASASSAVNSKGQLLSVGTKVTAEAKYPFLQNNLWGKVGCSTWVINGEVAKNDGKTFEFKAPLQTPGQSGCEVEGAPMEFSEMVFGFTSTAFPYGNFNLTSKWTIGDKTCHITGKELYGTIPSPKENRIEANSATGIVGSAGCGTSKLTAHFLLTETGTKNGVFIH